MINVNDTVSDLTCGLTYVGAKSTRDFYDAQINQLQVQLAELKEKRNEIDNICFVLRPGFQL